MIVCRWMEKNKFLVNPDGQVWPCCYLANTGYHHDLTGMRTEKKVVEAKVDDIVHPVMDEYFIHRDELNINKQPLEKILTHEWFTKTLPDSWKGDWPHRQCRLMCERADEKLDE